MTGVPVAPLRDALRVLEAEGILTIHPRAGIEFVKPGLELTRATYQFRNIIESSAVAAYAETADETEMAEIERRHLLAVAGIETRGPDARDDRDLRGLELLLHHASSSSLQNPLIETSYRRIHNYVRLRAARPEDDGAAGAPFAPGAPRHHQGLPQARRPADAVAAIQTHFANALQRNMGLY